MYTNDRNHSGIFGVVFFAPISANSESYGNKKAPFGAFRYYLLT